MIPRRSILIGALALLLLALPVAPAGMAAGPAEAKSTHCLLRHRVPAPIKRQILRRFVQLRHAPAGPVAARKALIRCGRTTTVILPIEPPPGRLRHCGDPGREQLCMPYQDDSIWRRHGDGRWKLRGGFLACQEFPPPEGDRFFKAGLCAELG